MIIIPTFASSITGDPNAAAIEAAINSAVSIYENVFANPIDVSIEFQEGGGLGGSEKSLYGINYADFYTAYSANAVNDNSVATTALASNVVPNQVNNPVTGNAYLAMSTADIRALGINCPTCTSSLPGGYDGIITLNTSITTPGSPGSTLVYSLMPVVEHEIDEVLGLGSSLAQTFQQYPSVEDLFRYSSSGARSYTTNSNAKAYFSINGTTDLAQFDNQNDGGDWGDWQSNPLPVDVSPKVQDAFATPYANPQLGVELTALEAIGYDAPEPGTFALLAMGLAALGVYGRRASRGRARQFLSGANGLAR
ncbi:MAG TPA: NF038122 family metalloprotease [Bryobacteraceae bacterium]|nr:NF038122 family metalloprotease [Bryobacteraceae bacterium]